MPEQDGKEIVLGDNDAGNVRAQAKSDGVIVQLKYHAQYMLPAECVAMTHEQIDALHAWSLKVREGEGK